MRFKETYEVHYNGKSSFRVRGLWRDAIGNDNIVSFKNSWREHVFSDKEVEALLEGKEITFDSTTGHLQYRMSDDGNKYFGFCANSFYKEYEKEPIFDPNVGSRYEIDRRNEAIMNQFMRVYYYLRLKNEDGTNVQSEFISDETMQRQGIDVIYFRNDRKYIIDEKAQMDYIYNKEPLPTFALELVNSSSGAIGWFVNTELETNYYMFIWPNAKSDSLTVEERKKKPLKIEDIRYADFALVNKETLRIEVNKKFSKSPEQLLVYAKKFAQYCKELENYDGNVPLKEGIESVPGKREGEIKGYKCFRDSFSEENGYLYYSKNKKERPVNLVVRRKWLEDKAEICGKITSSKVEIIQ